MLYERFVDARLKAVALTDSFRQTAANDPRRPIMWECVVRQTELARCLLESWLVATGEAAETANTAPVLR